MITRYRYKRNTVEVRSKSKDQVVFEINSRRSNLRWPSICVCCMGRKCHQSQGAARSFIGPRYHSILTKSESGSIWNQTIELPLTLSLLRLLLAPPVGKLRKYLGGAYHKAHVI